MLKRQLFIVKFFLYVFIHLLFWTGVYFFYTYFLGYGSANVVYVNRFSWFLMPVTITVSYFFLFFLIPKYVLDKKQFQFVLYSIYTFIISFFLIVVSIFYALTLLNDLKPDNDFPLTKTLPFIVLGVYLVILVVVTLGVVQHNFKSARKNEDLEHKFLQTQLQLKEQELRLLKMQIHPHFLFNTLNTLYGFSLKKSEMTPELILKLSSLLDYILYQVDKPKVLLKNEVAHIEDYIALEKMRFQKKLQIDFQKDVFEDSLAIPPMLLLPFVENAFKHGVPKNGILQIQIGLTCTATQLCFRVTNTAKRGEKSTKGIGLENIKKRLKMLFDDHFELEIMQNDAIFKVELKIPKEND